MPLTEDQKHQLRALGIMSRFCSLRDKLKGEGVKSNDAREQALATVLAEHGVQAEPTQRPDPGIVPSSETPQQTAKRLRVKRHRITKATFSGKEECSGAQAIEWAAGSICISDIGPKDAPSSLAWSWLEFGRTNPVARVELFKAVGRLARPPAGDGEEAPFHNHGGPVELPEFLREAADEGRTWRESDSVKAGLR